MLEDSRWYLKGLKWPSLPQESTCRCHHRDTSAVPSVPKVSHATGHVSLPYGDISLSFSHALPLSFSLSVSLSQSVGSQRLNAGEVLLLSPVSETYHRRLHASPDGAGSSQEIKGGSVRIIAFFSLSFSLSHSQCLSFSPSNPSPSLHPPLSDVFLLVYRRLQSTLVYRRPARTDRGSPVRRLEVPASR